MADSPIQQDHLRLLSIGLLCPSHLGPAAWDIHTMRNTRELADQILRDIAEINPYRGDQRPLAFIWATGFLARCCAEMIWRDSANWEVYKRIRYRASQKVAPLLDKSSE